EAVALDGEVGQLSGGLDGALRHDVVDATEVHAEADLRGVRAAAATLGRAGALDVLGKNVLEGHARRLESHRVDVGDVVADHVHVGHVVAKAGNCGEKRTHHGRRNL